MDPPAQQDIDSAPALRDAVAALFQPEVEMERAVQDTIAECMNEQGFDYVAYVDPDLVAIDVTESPVSDGLEDVLLGPANDDENPNDLIFGQLEASDPAASQAYMQALWGTEDNLGVEAPEAGVESLDLSEQALGCWAYSALELRGGPDRLTYTYEIIDLEGRLDELVLADPDYIAAEQAATVCKDGIGFADILSAFNEKIEEVEMLDLAVQGEAAALAQIEELRSQEIELNNLENQCDIEAGLEKTYDRLFERYFDEVSN